MEITEKRPKKTHANHHHHYKWTSHLFNSFLDHSEENSHWILVFPGIWCNFIPPNDRKDANFFFSIIIRSAHEVMINFRLQWWSAWAYGIPSSFLVSQVSFWPYLCGINSSESNSQNIIHSSCIVIPFNFVNQCPSLLKYYSLIIASDIRYCPKSSCELCLKIVLFDAWWFFSSILSLNPILYCYLLIFRP